jgi:hypothetical protein
MPRSQDIPRARDRQSAWFDQLCIPPLNPEKVTLAHPEKFTLATLPNALARLLLVLCPPLSIWKPGSISVQMALVTRLLGEPQIGKSPLEAPSARSARRQNGLKIKEHNARTSKAY